MKMDSLSIFFSTVLSLLLNCPYSAPVIHPGYRTAFRNFGSDAKVRRWADSAYRYITSLNCNEVFLTTSKECRKLKTVPKFAMNIYLTPQTFRQYSAVVPDEVLAQDVLHDAVLAVDPYPQANFGHLVVVFFIDSNVDYMTCHHKDGTYLGNGECMSLATRKRCRNAIHRRSRRRNFARRCEINFLPFVKRIRAEEDMYWGRFQDNALSCVSGLPGFARCPQMRPLNETTQLICNHLRDNNRRCSSTHSTIRTSCRMFEICDQAVIISGGWNRLTTGFRHKRNINQMYSMFRTYGFKRRNIKIFFANGSPGIQVPGEDLHRVHPAALKLALRYHIRALCQTSHCVDSLVIYMNSPAKNDGSSLLWDVNYDGLAEKSERYSVKELKRDLNTCKAKQVHIIVDQSYAGEVAQAFKNSHNHNKVIVYASGKSNEYSYNDEYTTHWAHANHSHSCGKDVHEQSRNSVRTSTPQMEEGRTGHIRSTIFGAPCNVYPPFTESELRQKYLGCQNLPTAMWLMKMFKNRPPTIEFNSRHN